jgi:hypothetical protein
MIDLNNPPPHGGGIKKRDSTISRRGVLFVDLKSDLNPINSPWGGDKQK